ncbi:MAG: efflux RND transporter periplasmic adaptor subunit [Oscillospiraceae bacterium]|jgi:multidrug efflux pump subunit AcrA (membrane-fusion protein)|nr:efflux RND transporter periplasmic adaptor subunit [Oscillospiraceae bacterium]
MKRYILLIVFTALVTFCVSLTGFYIKSLVVETDVININPACANNSIVCSGKVELEKTKSIFSQHTCTVKSVNAQEDSMVEEGQVIFEIINLDIENLSHKKSGSDEQSIRKKLPDLSDVDDMQSIYNRLTEPRASNNNLNSSKIQKIRAPISGILSSVHVKEGQPVVPGNLMACIADSSNLQVRLKINETQISELRLGQRANITGVGFKNITYNGSVKNIASQAQQNSDLLGSGVSVDVTVSVDNPDKNIKPGFTAKCEISTLESPNVIIVPYNCVKADDNGKEFVYVCKKRRSEKIYVETGKEFPNGFEIVSGIYKGDKVVANPDFVKDKSIVKIKTVHELSQE